ncbi:hypothetical protein ACLOJK_025225 [Asimina triloba]
MELMVRPRFPPCYKESQMPDTRTASEVVVIANDLWKPGDLVDWWSDGCFWSGRVTKLLGKDKVQIQLPEPPIGEGRSYEALRKDLRPSLNWSPENGWTVPASLSLILPLMSLLYSAIATEEGEGLKTLTRQRRTRRDGQGVGLDCGLLVLLVPVLSVQAVFIRFLKAIPKPDCPFNERKEDDSQLGSVCKTAACEVEQSSSLKRSVSSAPQAGFPHPLELGMPTKISCSEPGHKQTQMAPSSSKLNMEDGATRKETGLEDSVTNVDTAGSMEETSLKQERLNISQRQKIFGGDEQLLRLDTIESSVWALEELATKIGWLKGMLEYGAQWSNPSWEFSEN